MVCTSKLMCIPSSKLKEEYSNSEITRRMNEFPSLELLRNEMGDDSTTELSEEIYEKLKKSFDSRPPLIIYFNPTNLVTKTKQIENGVRIMYCNGDDEQVFAGMEITKDGYMYQGLYTYSGYYMKIIKDLFGSEIIKSQIIYEGGFESDKRYTYYNKPGVVCYKDGSYEMGCWREGCRDGTFEYFDVNGNKIGKKHSDEFDCQQDDLSDMLWR